MTPSRQRLAAQVALGLAVRLLPPPHKIGDARFFIHGRLALWPDWVALPEEETQRIARFLGCRPESLTDDGILKTELDSILNAASDFQAAGSQPAESIWNQQFAPVPGPALYTRIESWLEQLERRPRPKSKRMVGKDSGNPVELRASDISYRIPASHVALGDEDIVQLASPSPIGTVTLDAAALQQLAADIDRQRPSGIRYEELAIDKFLHRLQGPDGGRLVPSLEPGTTHLLVAPTGSGKSVFSRLLALYLAQQGIRVALVVPRIDTVWRETRRLTNDARAAGLDLTVAPLSSWRPLARRIGDYLDRPPQEDPEGRWVLEQVGYACHLAAYAEDQEPKPGDEPCTRLRQHVTGAHKDKAVQCPFSHRCGRFRAFHTAAAADIIVINHHGFLSGRVPLPVAVNGGEPCAMSTADLVLHRCGVVLLDEIDAFQEIAIGGRVRILCDGAKPSDFAVLK